MSLSSRFDKLPPPQYDSMPTKAGNGPKRTKSKKQTPNASGPQIIRPDVSNLVMQGKGNAPKGQGRKRKVNPNQNHQNQRKQQKVSNYPNASRGNWSDYQPVTNRGRGFNPSNGFQGNPFYDGNGAQNGGYRSYRTQGGAPRVNAQNNGPYRRQQRERML